MTSLPTTTLPKAARLPTWRELIEEEEKLREFLRARSRRSRVIAGPCVTPIMNGDVARVVELATGGLRIEWWVKGTGWTEAPKGAFDLADFIPGDTNRPVLEKDAIRLGCRLEDFGIHWTEERAMERDRTKISLRSKTGRGIWRAAGWRLGTASLVTHCAAAKVSKENIF
jgi:hypothetical protein